MSKIVIRARQSGKSYKMLLDVFSRGKSCEVVAHHRQAAELHFKEFMMLAGRSVMKADRRALSVELPNGEIVRFVANTRDFRPQLPHLDRVYDHAFIESVVCREAMEDYIKYALEVKEES